MTTKRQNFTEDFKREAVALRPNRVWLADITYVPTNEGWLYLAVILDLFSRKVVGWVMRDHMRTAPSGQRSKLPPGSPDIGIQRQNPADGELLRQPENRVGDGLAIPDQAERRAA